MELFKDRAWAAVGKKLLDRQETISVAESVTSGLLQYALGSIENASRFYQGGITAYNIGQKYKHLAVEPVHALSVNCVSEQVAKEMATEVCKLFKSNWGIGVTGYASPIPESGNNVFAFFAVAADCRVIKVAKLSPPSLAPYETQLYYIDTILDSLSIILQGS